MHAPNSRLSAPSGSLPADRAGLPRGLEAFAFSGGLAAAVAGTLCLAVTAALELSIEPAAVVLAAAGTLVIYGVDRLRDVERDRRGSPERTRFVLQHGDALARAAAVAAGAAAAALLALPASVWATCAGVGALGLLHRRLKGRRSSKIVYVTLAWLAITVGVPVQSTVMGAPGAPALGLAAAVVGAAVAANLLACNARPGHPGDLTTARGLAVLGLGVALAAPGSVPALGWIPLAQGAALAVYRPGEHFRAIALDGSLWIGATAACTHALAA